MLLPFAAWCEGQGAGDTAFLSRNHIRGYAAFLRRKGWSEATVAIHIRYLRAFLNWCCREELTAECLAKAVRRPGKLPPSLNMPEREEIIAVLAACDDGSFLGARDKAIILVLIDTGLRVSELCDLKLEHLSLDGKLRALDVKARQYEWGILSEETAAAVKTYLERRGGGSGPLFVNRRGGKLTPSGVRQLLRRRAKAAGVSPGKFHPHALRKVFASWWIRAGGHEYDLMQLGGWKTKEVLKHYVRAARLEELEEAHSRCSPVRHLTGNGRGGIIESE